jgi:lysophospholipase L1-like esterase
MRISGDACGKKVIGGDVMVEKIPLGALINLVQSGLITKERFSDYFELDPDRTRPFRPVFRLRKDTVEFDLLEKTASEIGHFLALDAERTQRLRRTPQLLPDSFHSILAVGDSWFSDPRTRTVIDVLQDSGYAINNTAVAGLLLEDIVARKDYLKPLSTGRVRHFLLSGGGNDVIGRLPECVKLFNVDYVDPEKKSDVKHYIKNTFNSTIMPLVKRQYQQVLDDIKRASPQTQLHIHGYAYARPAPHGPFLGGQFEDDRGFDLTNDERKALAWRVIMRFIDAFNDFLKDFAKNASGVHYLDFRGTVKTTLGPPHNREFGVNEFWFDEIHPSPLATKDMADKYKAVLPLLVAHEG